MIKLHPIAAGPNRNFGNVVFVHGVGGSPYATWNGIAARNEGDRFWPRWLTCEPGLDRLSFYTLEHPARLFEGIFGRVGHDVAPLLKLDREVLDSLLAEDALLTAPIAFVCHSLGGLVVKSMAVLANAERARNPQIESLFANIAQVTFLGTPHSGSGLASLVRSLRWFSTANAADLQKNHATLLRLNENYIGLTRNYRKRIDHLVFRETEKTGGFLKAMVVPPDSADPGIPGVKPQDVPGADHYGICNPESRTALVYMHTRDLLKTLADSRPYHDPGWARGLRAGSAEFSEFTEHYTQGPVPFGGRGREIAHLDHWLSATGTEPTLLLSAPAGRGKSALIVRWLEGLKQTTRVLGPRETPQAWHEGTWRLVFIPISLRFGTSSPRDYLRALASELAAHAGEPIPNPQGSEEYFRGMCQTLLAKLVSQSAHVLLVFDGLDEASPPETLQNLLPEPLPGTIKVLAAARWARGETDSAGWLARLGWDRRPRAQAHDLVVGPLDRKAIAEALVRMGESHSDMRRLGRDTTFIDRIAELTEGEPLMLRLFVEDMADLVNRRQPITLDFLADHRPGFAAYFARHLTLYHERIVACGHALADERTIDPAIAIIALANAGLDGEEFRAAAIAGFPDLTWDRDARSHLEPIERFLVARNGRPIVPYALIHPKLGYYIRDEHCDASLRHRASEAFCLRGTRHAENLNSGSIQSAEASPYVIQHLTVHLSAAGRPAAEFMALVEDGWRQARERLDGGHAGFAADTKAAWDACRREGTLAHLGAQWRCALVLSSIQSLGSKIPGTLLVELVKDGTLSPQQAQHYAFLKGPSIDAVQALTNIAMTFKNDPRTAGQLADAAVRLATSTRDHKTQVDLIALILENFQHLSGWAVANDPHLTSGKRSAVLAKALAAAKAITSNDDRSRAIAALAPHLEPTQRAEALAAARAIGDEEDRTRALTALVPHLEPTQRSETLAAARAISYEGYRTQVLTALAPHLDPAQRQEVLALALAAAQAIGHEKQRFKALIALAPHLDPAQRQGVLAEALAAAHSIGDDGDRCQALTALAPHVDPAQRQRVLAEALAAAHAIGHDGNRCQALTALSPHFDQAQCRAVLSEALAAAQAIASNGRSRAIAALAPLLDPAQRAEALVAARAIGDEGDRSWALAALAPLLDPAQRQAVLAEALAAVCATPPASRSWALGALAQHLEPAKRAEALAAAQAIGDEVLQIRALAALAPHLDPAQHQAVLAAALAAARSVGDEGDRFEALTELAPQLDPTQSQLVLAEALDAAEATHDVGPEDFFIDNTAHRTRALAALAPYLNPTLLARTVAAAHLIANEGDRIRALIALAPHLYPAQLAEALAATRAFDSEAYRTQALIALAPHLEPTQRAEALAAARAISDKGYLTQVLTALAPHLDPAQRQAVLDEALAAAQSISDEGHRLEALTELAPHLDADQQQTVLAEALAAAKAIGDNQDRVGALTALAPHLDADQRQVVLAEALAGARAIGNEGASARALAALTPLLEFGQRQAVLDEALAAAQAIGDETERCGALMALAPYLDPAQREAVMAEPLAALLNLMVGTYRPLALVSVRTTAAALNMLAGPAVMANLARAISSVCRWYP